MCTLPRVIFNAPHPPPVTGPSHGRDWTSGPAKFILIACLGAIAGTGLTWSILRDGKPASEAIATAASRAGLATTTNRAAPGSFNDSLDRDALPASETLPPPQRDEQKYPESHALSAPAISSATSNLTTPSAPASTQPKAGPAAADSTLLNLNTATQAQIELLPGIGPALASRIIEHRTKNGPFKSITDLDAVSGIGPKMIDKLKPLVRFE